VARGGDNSTLKLANQWKKMVFQNLLFKNVIYCIKFIQILLAVYNSSKNCIDSVLRPGNVTMATRIAGVKGERKRFCLGLQHILILENWWPLWGLLVSSVVNDLDC